MTAERAVVDKATIGRIHARRFMLDEFEV